MYKTVSNIIIILCSLSFAQAHRTTQNLTKVNQEKPRIEQIKYLEPYDYSVLLIWQ